MIIADAGLMQYAATTHPQLRLHLSVQGSATNYEAINFFHRHFHIRRAVLPRVLSLAQVKQVIAGTPAEIEVFGFGSLCVMVEGRCVLSSYRLERSIAADLAARQLESLMPYGACNGYWHGQPGLEQVAAMHRTVEA